MATNLISETPSFSTSPRISFSHDLRHKPADSVSSLEDYPFRWDCSLVGSDFDRTSENSSPRISFSHDLYQSDSVLLGFGSDIDLISENPSSPTSTRISFSHDLYLEYRSVHSIEGFGSDIDLVSENPRSSDSRNIYCVGYHSCCSVGFSSSESPRTSNSHCSDSLSLASDSSFDFCITNYTSANKEQSSSANELIPLPGTVELEHRRSIISCENSHNKRSLPVLLRSYSTGSLLCCKSLSAEMKNEFHF